MRVTSGQISTYDVFFGWPPTARVMDFTFTAPLGVLRLVQPAPASVEL